MSSASSFVSKQVAKSIKSSPFSDVPISGKGDKELFSVLYTFLQATITAFILPSIG